jgi:hypothetical protein
MDREEIYERLILAKKEIDAIKSLEISPWREQAIAMAAIEDVLDGLSDISEQYSLPEDDEFVPVFQDSSFISD